MNNNINIYLRHTCSRVDIQCLLPMATSVVYELRIVTSYFPTNFMMQKQERPHPTQEK